MKEIHTQAGIPLTIIRRKAGRLRTLQRKKSGSGRYDERFGNESDEKKELEELRAKLAQYENKKKETNKMGVFSRLKDMTKASINEVLDRVEDPILMLNQYLRDMEAEIAQAEVTVAKHMASERMLKQQKDESARIAARKEAAAEQALRNNQEAAARQALEEKKLYYDQKKRWSTMSFTPKRRSSPRS